MNTEAICLILQELIMMTLSSEHANNYPNCNDRLVHHLNYAETTRFLRELNKIFNTQLNHKIKTKTLVQLSEIIIQKIS